MLRNSKTTDNSNPISVTGSPSAETRGTNDHNNKIGNHAVKTIGNDHKDEISNRKGKTTGSMDRSNNIGNSNNKHRLRNSNSKHRLRNNNSKHRLRNNSKSLTRPLLHPPSSSKEHNNNILGKDLAQRNRRDTASCK